MTVYVTEEADVSIQEIFDFIEIKNPHGAWNVRDAIYDCLKTLDHFPRMWPQTKNPDYRKRIVTKYPDYSVYYRIAGQDVVVVLVHDGRKEQQPFER